jgi:hypothetical protein
VLVVFLDKSVFAGARGFIDQIHDAERPAIDQGYLAVVVLQLAILQQVAILRQGQMDVLLGPWFCLEFNVVVKESQGAKHLIVLDQVVGF